MEDMRNNAAFKRQVMLLSAGIVGIVSASFIKTGSTKIRYWVGWCFYVDFRVSFVLVKVYGNNKNRYRAGICLLLTVFLSMRLYKINNIADIFSFEFGTK